MNTTIDFNPDAELEAVRYMMTEDFPTADRGERREILEEVGFRLMKVGNWLMEPESYAPRWPE